MAATEKVLGAEAVVWHAKPTSVEVKLAALLKQKYKPKNMEMKF